MEQSGTNKSSTMWEKSGGNNNKYIYIKRLSILERTKLEAPGTGQALPPI